MTEIRPSKQKETLKQARTEWGMRDGSVSQLQPYQAPSPNIPLKHIPAAVKDLRMACEAHDKLLVELESRLNPVLTPQQAPANKTVARPQGNTELGSLVELEALHIYEMNQFVHQLLDRLEL